MEIAKLVKFATTLEVSAKVTVMLFVESNSMGSRLVGRFVDVIAVGPGFVKFVPKLNVIFEIPPPSGVGLIVAPASVAAMFPKNVSVKGAPPATSRRLLCT